METKLLVEIACTQLRSATGKIENHVCDQVDFKTSAMDHQKIH